MKNATVSQIKAVTSTSPAILNVAGAGSGKTTTIVGRVSRLIKEGVSPESILCITFTRKASNELGERLEKAIGKAAKKIWRGTFHAVSYKILSTWGERIGYQTTGGKAIAVVPPDEADQLFDTTAKAYGWKGSKSALAEAKQNLAHAGEWPENPNLERIIREYWATLRQCNAMDFDQLLLEVHRLFKTCPDALQAYKNRISHIFVDEYQDTDHQQYCLHEVINPANLYAVGDPDQAIYGWRGADLKIILNFEKSHQGAETIRLEECFRCGEPIVSAANNLISQNKNRIDKVLIPVIKDGEIEVLKAGIDGISKLLADEIEFNSPGEIAVIGRTHEILNNIQSACNFRKIPVFKVGAQSHEVESSEGWKNLHAVVRILLNQSDDLAFVSRGVKFTIDLACGDSLDALKNRAVSGGRGVFAQFCFEKPDHPLLQLKNLKEFENIVSFSKYWAELGFQNGMTQEIIDYLLENCSDKSPAQWLEWLAGKDMHTELERRTRDDQVTLLTAHASKGLEWDCVYLVGFNQGEFPKQKSIREGHLEEERRLAYVAFTRARKRLVIVYDGEKPPSQFIKEAGLLP